MKILVVGATGATGNLLVEQLLNANHQVFVVVRNAYSLEERIRLHENITIKEASILDLSDNELKALVSDCDAAASCLGHNLSLKGIYGPPRRLVAEATKRLCLAIKVNNPIIPIKFVLMNTTGNSNRDLEEPISIKERLVVGLIRILIPPHVDNEQAADYLRTQVGQNDSMIEWVAVRPDSLINEEIVSPYHVYPSPTRSAIFDSGKTSRINVAHFMAELITNSESWEKWKGQMPVIYNEMEKKK